jgi:membrane protein required for colicin V production
MQKLDIGSFTSFDWFLIALIAISVVLAFRRGLLKVLFSLAGLLAGLLVASWNYDEAARLVLPYSSHRVLTGVLTFLFLLLVTYFCFVVTGALVRKTVHAVGLGFIDRAFGAIFGLFRGLLIGAVLLVTLAAFLPNSPWIRSSLLAPYFFTATHAVSFVVPETFGQQITMGASRLLSVPSAQPAIGSAVVSKKHQALRARRTSGGE